MLWQRLQEFFQAKFGARTRPPSRSLPAIEKKTFVFSPQALSRSRSCGLYTDMTTPANATPLLL
ncbi:hypothetical protein ACHHYP_20354 [Achlya hypogyna]|uniref:Uncharacterized protein n=1 Tax=Achlya hypogyna TaxID=1202772 RepID=A0A1V9ZL06_ACHHY|nr:hypothetical protein ACHHYP_20354 [Achlya hypogyna]